MKYIINLILLFFLLSNIARAQEDSPFTVIITHDELELRNDRIIAIPNMGPFTLNNNSLRSLIEGNEIETISFPDSIWVDDIIWTGETFVIRSEYDLW